MCAARFARGLARNALKATAYGAGTAVVGTSLTLGVGHAAEYLAENPSLTEKLPIDPNDNRILLLSRQMLRAWRVSWTMTIISMDYKYSFYGLYRDKNPEEYSRMAEIVNQRAAEWLLWLSIRNKGIFVKAGQFIASMTHVLPKEYTTTLAVLQDKVEPRPMKEIQHVIQQELGADVDDIFYDFDLRPLGTASIAQVHKAKLKSTGELVAVKVQHQGLETISYADLATLDFLAPVVSWMFPSFEFGWLLPEFESAVKMELDFINEGMNAERCARNFADFPQLKTPRILWQYTTKRILLMEFEEGVKVTEKDKLIEMGLNTDEIARLLVEVFAKQVFLHGFVHSDPHPGNILARPMAPNSKTPQLVLLDHGLYKDLGDEFRLNYAHLWKALVLRDQDEIKYYAGKLGAGEFSDILALILTLRPADSKEVGLRGRLSEEDRQKMRKQAAVFRGSFFDFLEGLPRELLFVFKTLALLRSINRALDSMVPSPIIMARYSLRTIYLDSKVSGVFSGLKNSLWYTFERIRFEFRLQMFSWLTYFYSKWY